MKVVIVVSFVSTLLILLSYYLITIIKHLIVVSCDYLLNIAILISRRRVHSGCTDVAPRETGATTGKCGCKAVQHTSGATGATR